MKRAIMAAMLILMPAVAIAQHEDRMTVPEVPKLALVPARSELEQLRERNTVRWTEVPSVPSYRWFADPERELAWASAPFGSPYPLLTLVRF
jgi:hypothetical protein